MVDRWAEVRKIAGGEQQSAVDMGLGGIPKSFGYGVASSVGVEAPPEVERWRQEYPTTGLVTEFAGIMAPYLAYGAGALRSGSAIARASGAATAGIANPLMRGAAREALRWAPIEIGRVGVGAMAGPEIAAAMDSTYEGTLNLAGKAGVDLALGGVIGGAFEGVKSAGKALAKRRNVLPGVDLDQPKQLQIRQLEENLAQGRIAPDFVDDARSMLGQLKRDVVAETLPKGQRYVRDRDLHRLFNTGETNTLDRRFLRQGPTDFSKPDLDSTLARARFPTGWEAGTQFPRYNRAKTSDAARQLQKAAMKLPETAGSDTRWGRDGDEGLFVFARKIGGGFDKARRGDEWVFWKTDQPGKFVPDSAKFADKGFQVSAWLNHGQRVPKPEGVELYDSALATRQGLNLEDYRGLMQDRGNAGKMARSLAERTGLNRLEGADEITRRIGGFMNRYVSPAMFQFRNNPRAAMVFANARKIYDDAIGIAERKIYGAKVFREEANLFEDVLGKVTEEKGSIAALARAVSRDDEQWLKFWQTVSSGGSVDDAIELGLRGDGLRLLKQLQAVDAQDMADIQKLAKALGKEVKPPRPGHYGVSHTWEGDWRVPVYDGSGRLVYVGSGKQRATAVKRAERYAAANTDLQPKVQIPDQPGDFKLDFALLEKMGQQDFDPQRIRRATPSVTLRKSRRGVGGFTGEERPWTYSEFIDLVSRNARGKQRYLAELSVEDLLNPDITKLLAENPRVAEDLIKRMNMLKGEQGPISQWQNRVADEVLSPYLGKNSASKVVGALNSAMFQLTLGFFNTGYAMANMFTFVQTSMPQVAYLMSASDETLSRYYTFWPAQGRKTMGQVGTLEPMKIAGQAFKEMGRPDPVLKSAFRRAAQDGVWDPRFIEDYLGQNSRTVTELKNVLKGDEPFSSWLKSLGEFLPASSEKLSRGHSFVMGHVFGRDVLGLKDEALYRFAREFTEKTQFNYASSDRAQLITGPMGGAFGLFKNWVMHYIGWMMEYTGEGVMRGNWTPLMWGMGGTAAIGGLGGLPFIGAVDSMQEWFTEKDLMLHTYEQFGQDVADGVYYGLPAFLGFSIQNQVSAPFANFGSDAQYLFSFAYVDRMRAIGRMAGEAIDHWNATGEHPVKDQGTRDAFMRAFAPKSIYRLASMDNGTIRSLNTGYPMVTGLTAGQKALYALGLNPTTVERGYEVNQKLWQDQNAMREAVGRYGEAWAQAQMARDSTTIQQIVTRAIAEGVDLSSVIKSAGTRMEKMRSDMISRQFRPIDILPYRQAGAY